MIRPDDTERYGLIWTYAINYDEFVYAWGYYENCLIYVSEVSY
jgi:hypothetical protein